MVIIFELLALCLPQVFSAVDTLDRFFFSFAQLGSKTEMPPVMVSHFLLCELLSEHFLFSGIRY